MPWLETDPMIERLKFVQDALSDRFTMADVCQFRAGDHAYCYPLTVADLTSRFVLTCHKLRSTKCELAKPIFERAFREYGLPRAIRTDNGVPFATAAIHGLSFLTVYWMQLGIAHQRIRSSSPQKNGAHERMHRTLKRQAIKPVRQTGTAQQRNFDVFRREYNDERPHDALGQRTPASQYTASPRSYPTRLDPSVPRALRREDNHDGRHLPFRHAADLPR